MGNPTVIVANDEDLKNENAKLKAMHEEDEKKAKTAMDDHEKEVAKLKANLDDRIAEPGPVVKAIIATMDEDKMEEAKKAIRHAIDEEDNETKKAEMEKELKALEEIFETGNGVNTNAQDMEKEKEKDAVIASLTAKVSQPIIKKILTAKQISGATEEDLKTEQKRLTALTFPKLQEEYESQEIFINQALKASVEFDETKALVASVENAFEFNGAQGMALVGKSINLDEAIEEAATQ